MWSRKWVDTLRGQQEKGYRPTISSTPPPIRLDVHPFFQWGKGGDTFFLSPFFQTNPCYYWNPGYYYNTKMQKKTIIKKTDFTRTQRRGAKYNTALYSTRMYYIVQLLNTAWLHTYKNMLHSFQTQ